MGIVGTRVMTANVKWMDMKFIQEAEHLHFATGKEVNDITDIFPTLHKRKTKIA